jgi:hypothetical protein
MAFLFGPPLVFSRDRRRNAASYSAGGSRQNMQWQALVLGHEPRALEEIDEIRPAPGRDVVDLQRLEGAHRRASCRTLRRCGMR